MKNGDYILIIAPENYPYKKYRGKYAYEHIVTWWINNGTIPDGYIIHHKDRNKHNNDINNLQLIEMKNHSSYHTASRGIHKVTWSCGMCNTIFTRNYSQTPEGKNMDNKVPFCSRKCSGTYGTLPDNLKVMARLRAKKISDFHVYPNTTI